MTHMACSLGDTQQQGWSAPPKQQDFFGEGAEVGGRSCQEKRMEPNDWPGDVLGFTD